jgi:hypothetical protein
MNRAELGGQGIPVGTPARPPWAGGDDGLRHRKYTRAPWEWLPRPHAGRIMLPVKRQDQKPIHVQVVPGPGHTWQIVRVDLESPFARGFATREEARSWISRAVRQGVLPEGVVEVEPATA